MKIIKIKRNLNIKEILFLILINVFLFIVKFVIENLIRKNHAEVSNTVEIGQSVWNDVHYGLQLAGQSYSVINTLPYKIAAKTGTAQERTTEPDHATIVSYAPYDNPEVAVAIMLPNGYSSSSTILTAADIYRIYYGADEEATTQNNN